MSLKPVSPFLKAWYKWKTLRLPWRRQFLVGLDLSGNTYWEFRDARAVETGRVRRIVKYPRKTHYGDVAVPPAWHQWLRHTRPEPPSLGEQRSDVARQARMKALAAEADARWAAKPSLVDAPGRERGQPAPALESSSSSRKKDVGGDAGGGIDGKAIPGALKTDTRDVGEDVDRAPVTGERKQSWRKMREEQAQETGQKGAKNPWNQTRGAGESGKAWQPQGWDPSAASKHQ